MKKPIVVVKDKRKRITYKERLFAQNVIKNRGNATKAALETLDVNSYDSAASRAHQLMQKPSVRDLIESYASRSVDRIETLADSARSEYVKLEANKDILDRAGYKSVERTQHTEIVVNLSGTIANKRHVQLPESTTHSEPDGNIDNQV